jgi:hypothetical protein
MAPLTLDEATARVKARAPRRAVVASTTPTPDSVGTERQRLEEQQLQTARERIAEYREVMGLLKSHGVAAPEGADAASRGRAPRATIAAPLQILAEGDSWFEYPYPLFGGGIIPRLARRLGVPILNLAKAGDEVRFMLGVKQRAELIEQLGQGSPAGGDWDVLLFSGGGNDIVDDPMALWINDFDPAVPAASNINQPRFDAALSLIRSGYEDLIALRDGLSPGTHLFFHAYDFAIPDGRGACHLGPWLKPSLELRRFPNLAARMAVVKEMLLQFAALLQGLANAHPRVTLINAQGLLAPRAQSWHNELHPSKAGFDAFADRFRAGNRRAVSGSGVLAARTIRRRARRPTALAATIDAENG